MIYFGNGADNSTVPQSVYNVIQKPKCQEQRQYDSQCRPGNKVKASPSLFQMIA